MVNGRVGWHGRCPYAILFGKIFSKTTLLMKDLTFSVIVPTYERPLPLAHCLQALSGLDFPREDFEVIVVDDGGNVDLTAVLQPIADKINIPNGRFLAFTDDDCRVDGAWLKNLAAALQETPSALVGGQTGNGLPDNLYASASQLLIDYLYDYAARTQSPTMRFFTSNNMAVAAAAFAEIGGFNAAMPLAAGEDREFCGRWLAAGRPMIFMPAAVVQHYHALTWRTFWRQHVGYGRGAYQFHQIRAAKQQTPIRVEPYAFYGQLLRYPFVKGNGR
ncbi:MAG: glycosyltransferase, partial [Anaerolineae bacterium]